MRIVLFCLLTLLPFCSFSQKKYKELQSKAFELIKNKKFTEASSVFDELIKQKPKISENYYWKGFCYVSDGKNIEAIEVLNIAIEKNPKNWNFYKSRGDAYYNSKKYQESLQDYEKAIDLEPTKQKDTLFWYIADAYRKLSQYEKAIENYSKAIQINPQNPDLYYHRGFCYSFLPEKEKYKSQACSDYQKAFEGGIKKAKPEAWEIFRCDFAKPEIKKDNAPVAISKVEIEPFTGAIIISKGISYERFELYVGKSETDFLVGNEIASNSEIVFKVIKPRGFRENENDQILFGTDFAIYEKEKLLQKSEDLYKDDFTGVNAEMLKSLKLTITPYGLQENKEYSFLVRFFDKQSNAEISISLPFIIKSKTRTDRFINSSFGVLGQGTTSKSVGDIDIQRIEWRQNQKVVGKLKGNQNFELWLVGVKNLQGSTKAQYAWINAKNGEKIEQKNLSLQENKGTIQIKNLTPPTQAGKYIFWLKVEKNFAEYQYYAFTAEIEVE
ncbi:tetratricopeptide repeat protein [Raineya sp.]|jgi:tetratricopeptide (TPR) repeat protein